MSYLWNPVPSPVFTQAGAFAPGAKAYFYVGNTSTPLEVFSDSGLNNELPWPVIADLIGVFPPIYIPYGSYRRKITTKQGVLISDAGNIDNPAPPSGGGGIIVTQDEIFNTGDVKWRIGAGPLSGFVRMNGLTIGNAASGATEQANADTQALYEFLWLLPDSIAPVTGGRGASSIADFNAGKPIGIPTMQGTVMAGVGGMGNSIANDAAVTTCTTDGVTAVVVLASATGVAVGMTAFIAGVASGIITALSGVNATLSAIPPTAQTGVQFIGTFFSLGADQPGANAGAMTQKQTTDQMPPHTHTSEPHTHPYTLPNLVNITPGGSNVNAGSLNLPEDTGPSTVVIDNTGGGNPFPTLQPTRLGTFYMHL